MSCSAIIRDYRQGDEAGAFHVCLKTGDHGRDGEPLYREDPEALGRVYVGPYFKFAPEYALILEDADGICGYALGALDSRSFYERYDREWRPKLCQEFPAPQGDPARWSHVQEVYDLYHHPDYFCPEPYAQYPSHLHIDLLARARGQGHGRRILEAVMGRLCEQGSPGVHLGMNMDNATAYGFYRALGFQELVRQGAGASGAVYMGKIFLKT